MIRIWLDDIREMPEGFTHWAKNAYQAIGLIIPGNVNYISFDHDLGNYNNEKDEKNNGYEVAKFIEFMAYNREIKPIAWDIHSANPVGRKRIELTMQSANRFWNDEE
jgi:hypothetical protein